MRDNQTWISQLAGSSEVQASALEDLRRFLKGGLARSLGGRPQVNQTFLDDVVQDALVQILSHLGTFEGRSLFTTWAMAIGVRIALRNLRRKYWQDTSLEQAASGSELIPELAVDLAAGPEQRAEQQSILARLSQVIETELTDLQKLGIQAELSGMPIAEIADRLQSNPNATYKLLHDARKRLKRGLQKAGYSAAEVQSAFS